MYVWSNIHQKSVTSFMDAPIHAHYSAQGLSAPLCRVPRSIVLQQELAAAGKRYGYDTRYVQATIYRTYNTASPLHHAVA